MDATVKENPHLDDKYVWIIDDEIPIHLAAYERDDMLSGERWIDRGTLMSLLQNENWDEDPVKLLIGQLVEEAENVIAFIQPGVAIEHLMKGAIIPDSIVYDLGYRNIPTERSLEYLEKILRLCISVVQVYTKESVEEARKILDKLLGAYPTRLEEPLNKTDTDASELASSIAEKIDKSLSARLAGEIRRLSVLAIESVLVKIDDLPIEIAVKLLAGERDKPDELELVELLAIKVTEVLGQKQDLKEAVGKYATNKGVPEDKIGTFADELVTLLTSHVHEFIQQDNQFIDATREVWQKTIIGQTEKKKEETDQIIKNFLEFRMYTKPTDGFVRTGDIVQFDDAREEHPDLFLVLTPLCDLDRFWQKARGSLTVVRMRPFVIGKGVTRTLIYGNKNFEVGASVIAQHPLILTSVPVSTDTSLDYAIFMYEIETKNFEAADLLDVGKKNKKVKSSLTYSELEGAKHICKVSEPFLSGILSDLQNKLFRLGVPNFPAEEKSRLNKIIADEINRSKDQKLTKGVKARTHVSSNTRKNH